MLNILSINSIPALLMSYGYIVYFPITVIEGPVATVIAGFLISLGYFNFFWVYVIGAIGDLVGDLIYYSIGYWGSNRILARGSFLKIKVETLKKIENHYKNHPGKTLLFGKWTHSVGAAILLAGGMSKMPLKTYLWFNLLGTLPKVLVFVIIGYYFGEAYSQIDKYLGYGSLLMFIAIALAVGIYFLMKKIRQKINID